MTPTPTITPTPDRAGSVATALAAATMQAQATAQARTTAQAARAVADDQAGRSAIIYSPTKGQLDHNTNTVGGEGKLANVNTAELILEAKFFNPYPASEGAWDYGFAFRYLPNNNQYTLIVRSDQLYYLYFYDSAIQRNQQISAGRIAGLDISSGGANTVTVFIGADSGLLFVNGAYVATLDLSAQLTGGNVAIVTGILTGDKIAGRSTGYEGFTIYAARR